MVLIVVFSFGCKKSVDIDGTKLDSLENDTKETPIEPSPLPAETPPAPIPEPAVIPVNESIPAENITINETVNQTITPPQIIVADSSVDDSGNTKLVSIFNVSGVKKMKYRFVKNGTFFVAETSIIEDSIDEKLVWKLISEYTLNGATIVETQWVDKDSTKCIKGTLIFNGAQSEAACPIFGPTGTSRTSRNIDHIGYQTINTALGELKDVAKYVGNNVTYWAQTGKPVPVKYAVSDGRYEGTNLILTAELESWS